MPVLIADIGGTNARFALASDSAPYYRDASNILCADFENVETGIEFYLKSLGIDQVSKMVFAAAGPVRQQSVKFTNNHWEISCQQLERVFDLDSAHLLNDFEAIAYSLSELAGEDIMPVGGNWQPDLGSEFVTAVLGPGTGLGVATLFHQNDQYIAISTEGGHCSFAPVDELQIEIQKEIGKHYERVSNERLLSGNGLENIYQALAHIEGIECHDLTAVEIGRAATQEEDDLSKRAMHLFFKILGQVAGDTALMAGAKNGIFIGGGICQRYPEFLLDSNFRNAFESKGRHESIMQSIPTWLIMNTNPGLLGAAIYAANLK